MDQPCLIGGCYDTAKRSTNGVPRHSINGVSKKFRRMAGLYRLFARHWTRLDFSDDALLALYNHESYGSKLNPDNGFAVGKRYLNLTVTDWRADITEGLLYKHELYEDELFADYHWWLDSVLKNCVQGSIISVQHPWTVVK